MRSIGSAHSSRVGSGSAAFVSMSNPGSAVAGEFARGTTPIIEDRIPTRGGRETLGK